jgi:hypothetical protein
MDQYRLRTIDQLSEDDFIREFENTSAGRLKPLPWIELVSRLRITLVEAEQLARKDSK